MTTLYDHNGQPFTTKSLTQSYGDRIDLVSSIRNSQSIASTLDAYRLARVLREAELGNNRDFLVLAQEIEDKDPQYYAVTEKRRLAGSTLDYFCAAPTDDANAVEIAEQCQRWLEDASLDGLIYDFGDANQKGYAGCEAKYDTDGKYWFPTSFTRLDPWDLEYAPKEPKQLKLRIGEDRVSLHPILHIIHKKPSLGRRFFRGGVARVCSVIYLVKTFDMRDWAAFAEVFGMPIRLGRYNAQDGMVKQEDLAILHQALRGIGVDFSAALPRGMDIEFHNASQGAGSVYPELAHYLDEAYSKAVLGQTMTTDNGSSLSQSVIHLKEQDKITYSDAMGYCRTIQQQIIRPLVVMNFGPDAPMPLIKIREAPEDLDKFAARVDLLGEKLGVEASFVRDKLGWPEPADGAELYGDRKKEADMERLELETQAAVAAGGEDDPENAETEDKPAKKGIKTKNKGGGKKAEKFDIAREDWGGDSPAERLMEEAERLADKKYTSAMERVEAFIQKTADASQSPGDFIATLRTQLVDEMEAFRVAVAESTFLGRAIGDARD